MWTRPATDSDFEGITRIDAAAAIDEDRRALTSQGFAQKGCWISGHDDLPEGYLVLSRRHLFGRDFVSLVMVKDSARRRGLASALFQAAEASATTSQLFTSTNQSNRPMQALLETRDYLKPGVIDHLDLDDPEIVFVRYRSRLSIWGPNFTGAGLGYQWLPRSEVAGRSSPSDEARAPHQKLPSPSCGRRLTYRTCACSSTSAPLICTHL